MNQAIVINNQMDVIVMEMLHMIDISQVMLMKCLLGEMLGEILHMVTKFKF